MHSLVNRPLAKKFLAESILLLLACAVALFAFSWFRVWVVGELDTARFKQIVDMLPQDWRKFSSVDFDWLVSYLGRTALTLDEPMLLMIISIWAIVRGSDVVSGELSRGTMELVLAQPISRRRVYFQHMFLTMCVSFGLCLLVWLGMSIGVWTTAVEESFYPELKIPFTSYALPLTFMEAKTEQVPMRSLVSPVQFYPGIINLFCFSVFVSCFAAFCSARDRYRWRTLGIVIGCYMVSAMVKLLAMSSEAFSWLRYVTVFGYYEPAPTIQRADEKPETMLHWLIFDEAGVWTALGPLANNLVLLGLGLILLIWGGRFFNRRDLPAPL